MRIRATRRACVGALAVTVAMLALTGCGADGDGGESGAAHADSPLRKYLGYTPFDRGRTGIILPGGGGMTVTYETSGGASSDAVQLYASPIRQDGSAASKADRRSYENLVAECMRKQGFEYVPYVADAQQDDDPDPYDKARDLPPEKFAKRWGYGIATTTDVDATYAEKDPSDDPNQMIRKGLSAKAREAYDTALYGTEGCNQRATRKVYGDPEKRAERMRSFAPLFEDLNAMVQRLGRDATVVDARDAWSDCMADAGHTGLDSPRKARESIRAKLERLYNGKMTDAEVDRLAEREVALATADHECAQDGLADVRANVAERLETEFLRNHEGALERYRDFRTRDRSDGENQGSDGSDGRDSSDGRGSDSLEGGN